MVHQTGAGAVTHLKILLAFDLGWHELHVWQAQRGADRLAIVSVVLLMLDEGLHVSWRNDPERVTKLLKLALPEAWTGAGFDPDRTGLQLCQSREKLIPS